MNEDDRIDQATEAVNLKHDAENDLQARVTSLEKELEEAKKNYTAAYMEKQKCMRDYNSLYDQYIDLIRRNRSSQQQVKGLRKALELCPHPSWCEVSLHGESVVCDCGRDETLASGSEAEEPRILRSGKVRMEHIEDYGGGRIQSHEPETTVCPCLETTEPCDACEEAGELLCALGRCEAPNCSGTITPVPAKETTGE